MPVSDGSGRSLRNSSQVTPSIIPQPFSQRVPESHAHLLKAVNARASTDFGEFRKASHTNELDPFEVLNPTEFRKMKLQLWTLLYPGSLSREGNNIGLRSSSLPGLECSRIRNTSSYRKKNPKGQTFDDVTNCRRSEWYLKRNDEDRSLR